MEHTLRPSTEPANSSQKAPVLKEEKLPTESSDNTKNNTQSEQSNPLRINDTEAWLGKCIIIVGAPPPQK
jgi:hypothetical protein